MKFYRPADDRSRRHCRTLMAAVGLVLVAATGCSSSVNDFGERKGSSEVPSGASIASLPPLPGRWATLDRNDAATVAVAAVQAIFDWHPERSETGPEIAARRAAPLFTPRATESYRVYPVPRPTWQAWMDSRTTITAETTIGAEEHPVDTDVAWSRKVFTILTISTPGKSATTLSVVSLVTANRQPVWTVSALTHLS